MQGLRYRYLGYDSKVSSNTKKQYYIVYLLLSTEKDSGYNFTVIQTLVYDDEVIKVLQEQYTQEDESVNDVTDFVNLVYNSYSKKFEPKINL